MRKKVISILLTAAMAVTLFAGCGDEKSADSQGNQSSGDAKTVTMMSWYSEDQMDDVIDAIEKKLGWEYKIDYTYVTNSDYNNVLSTQLAAGEGPDIIADGANFPARIKAGNVKDITDTGITDGFSDEGLALCTIDGKNYGVPCYGWFAGIFYNKDLFEKAGIKEVPTTYDEFLEACDKLKGEGIKPIAMGLPDGDNGLHAFTGFLESNFYEVTEEGKTFDVNFAEGKEKMSGVLNPYVESWMKMVDDGYITSDMVGISSEQARNEFSNGKAAMFITGPWDYDIFKKVEINFGVMPFLGDGEEAEYLIGGPAASWGINSNTKNEEGAEKVLEALASTEVQQAFVDANPGGSTYKEGVKTGLPEEYANVEDVLKSGRIACCWDRWSVNMPSQTLIDEINSQIQGLVSGESSIDDFLSNLDSKADSIRYQ